jgi:hypothetical protein
MDLKLIAQHLVPALRQSLHSPGLCLIGLDGGRAPGDEQREPWIKIKYGSASAVDWVGVVPATARFVRARGAPQETLDLVVKINPVQGLARNLIPWITARHHIVLDRPFVQYRSAAEFDRTADREPHVYQAALQIPALRDVLPRCYGWAHDPATGEHALFLECVTEIDRLDASGAAGDWPPEAISAALRAAARWQAAFWGADNKRLAWAGPRPTTSVMVADTPLWRGLLNDARARFPHIVTQEVWRRRYGLIETMGDWHKVKDALPATLAHNDFNQRNVGFRGRASRTAAARERPRAINGHAAAAVHSKGVGAKAKAGFAQRLLPQIKALKASADVALREMPGVPHHSANGLSLPMMGSNSPIESDIVVLDWEVAQCNTAARDLVELLTFVLPPNAERADVDHHVETHRDALIKAGVSTGIERDVFVEGFRCELRVQAINRIGLQFLFGAQFQLAYLTRINATIERLLDLYD